MANPPYASNIMRGSRHQLRHSRVADVIKCPTVETILAYPKEQRWSLWDDATCRWCTLAPCRGAEYPCCVRMSPKQMAYKLAALEVR